MKKKLILFLILFLFLIGCTYESNLLLSEDSIELYYEDEYTFPGEENFLTDFPAKNTDGTINVVVEIPAGTNQKWEVSKDDGKIRWEFKEGKPRVVKYLAYPGNYGMIPQTILLEEEGGDGDALDVIILGPSVPRGTVVKAKLIGILNLLDGGETDDKILAVLEGSPLYEVNDIQELDNRFPGTTKIIEIWFSSYKGAGILESKGFGDASKAHDMVNKALNAYRNKK